MNEQTRNTKQADEGTAEVIGHAPVVVHRPRNMDPTDAEHGAQGDGAEVTGHAPIVVNRPRPAMPEGSEEGQAESPIR